MKLNRKTLRKMILSEMRDFYNFDKPMSRNQQMVYHAVEDVLKEEGIVGFSGEDIGRGSFGHTYNPATSGFDFLLGGKVIYSIDSGAFTTFSIPMLRHINR